MQTNNLGSRLQLASVGFQLSIHVPRLRNTVAIDIIITGNLHPKRYEGKDIPIFNKQRISCLGKKRIMPLACRNLQRVYLTCIQRRATTSCGRDTNPSELAVSGRGSTISPPPPNSIPPLRPPPNNTPLARQPLTTARIPTRNQFFYLLS